MKLDELIKKKRELRDRIEETAHRIYCERMDVNELLDLTSELLNDVQEVHALETKEY